MPAAKKKPVARRRTAKPKFEFARQQREDVEEVLADLRDACDGDDDLVISCITGEGNTKKVEKLLDDQEEGEIDYAIGFMHAVSSLTGMKAERVVAAFPAEDEDDVPDDEAEAESDDDDEEDEDFVADADEDEKPARKRRR